MAPRQPSSFYRRVAALSSILCGAFFMIWKIRNNHVLADEIRFSQKQVAEAATLLSSSSSLPNNISTTVTAEDDATAATGADTNTTTADAATQNRARLQRRRDLRGVIPYPVAYARQRTKINTFYAPIQTNAGSKREEKVFAADQRLIEEWKHAWYQAGWEPVVLTLEHAKQHPLFDSYWQRLEQNVEMLGKGGRNEEYNRYCFLRFLAMASVGGGLLGDYDMMPLVPSSSMTINGNGGVLLPTEFTVYQKTLNKAGGIPSLAAGSASEWQRMADAIWTLGETQPSPGGLGWSDMLAVMQLAKSNPDAYRLQNQVLGYKELMDAVAATQEQQQDVLCNVVSAQACWAVHFSHYDVQSQGHTALDRPQVIHEFLTNYNEKCQQRQHASKKLWL